MKNYKEFLKVVPKELIPAVEQTREIILSCSKELREEIKWGSPTYYINKHICSIHVHKEHINLQFFFGAKLKSADLLEGTGKTMRHLKIANPKDIVQSKIKMLVKEAIEFDKLINEQV